MLWLKRLWLRWHNLPGDTKADIIVLTVGLTIVLLVLLVIWLKLQ